MKYWSSFEFRDSYRSSCSLEKFGYSRIAWSTKCNFVSRFDLVSKSEVHYVRHTIRWHHTNGCKSVIERFVKAYFKENALFLRPKACFLELNIALLYSKSVAMKAWTYIDPKRKTWGIGPHSKIQEGFPREKTKQWIFVLRAKSRIVNLYSSVRKKN